MNKIAAIQQEASRLTKTAQGYGYMYMPLGDLLDTLLPLFKKYGLGWTATFTMNHEIIGDVLYQEYKVTVYEVDPKVTVYEVDPDESAELLDRITSSYLIEVGRPQNTGTQETYYRRYGLLSMLGLATVDNDGTTETSSKKYVEPDMSGTGDEFE